MQWLAVSVVLTLLGGVQPQPFSPAAPLEVYPDNSDSDVLQGRTPLYFAHMQSFGGQFDSSGSLAGVKVALDEINSNSNMLPEYTLHYTLTNCSVNYY